MMTARHTTPQITYSIGGGGEGDETRADAGRKSTDGIHVLQPYLGF